MKFFDLLMPLDGF